MSLITPDFGLLVWMTLIFGIVFFVLAKWGFPMITGSVEKRAQRIGESIKAAKEAEERLRNLAEEQSRMIEETRQEQSRILKEAAASRDNIVEQAKVQAREEASRILDQARTQIAAEKESALRDVRKEVALLSVSVAEKVLKALKAAKIFAHAYLMYDFPTETKAEQREAERYVKGLAKKRLIQSCFWHRFALTVHSPIAKKPGKFGIMVGECKSKFARNELSYTYG